MTATAKIPNRNRNIAVSTGPASEPIISDPYNRPCVAALRTAAELLSKVSRFGAPQRPQSIFNDGGGSASTVTDEDIEAAQAMMGAFEKLPSPSRFILARIVVGKSLASIANEMKQPLYVVEDILGRACDALEGIDWTIIDGG